MIEQILTRKNMLRAMYRVQKNHGSAGVDHMPVTKLTELMSIDKEELSANVRSGSYLPQAILGVEISFAELVNSVLGFGFVPTYKKGVKGKYQSVVSEKSWAKLKHKLKTITRKTIPMSFNERIQKLIEVQRGWVNNFRMASIQNKLNELDGWLRNRLRYCIWHHWYRACELTTKGSNKSERKRKNLIRLGIEQGQAYAWSRSRMGGWATKRSVLTTIGSNCSKSDFGDYYYIG